MAPDNDAAAVPVENPAVRLHAHLQAFGENARRMGSAPVRKVWARVFGVPETDVTAIFEHLVALRGTANDLRALVGTVPGTTPALHLRYADRWQSLLDLVNLDNDCRNVSHTVEEVVLQPLENAAHILGLMRPEPVVTPDELRAAATDLDTAAEVLRNAAMDAEVRAALFSALDAIRLGLSRYRTAGVRAFWDAWVAIVGTIIVRGHREAVLELLGREDMAPVQSLLGRVRGWGASFVSGATTALRVVDAGNKILEAAERLKGLNLF